MEPDVVALTERAFTAIARGDIEAFVELTDPEVEFNSLIGEADRRNFHGHEGVREWFAMIRESLGGVRFEIAENAPGEQPGVAITKIQVTGEAAGVEVGQVMWQAVYGPEGVAKWWGIFRTREEAVEAARERVG